MYNNVLLILDPSEYLDLLYLSSIFTENKNRILLEINEVNSNFY